jgi:ABC-type Na+ efflux pump permease subunit
MLFFLLFANRIRVLLSDWRFLLAMVVFPLFLSLMAGNALDRQKQLEMTVLGVDGDNTDASRALIQGLEQKPALRIVASGADAARQKVQDNQAEAWLLIPEGFSARLQTGDLAGFLRLETAASADSRGFLTELVASEVFRISGQTDMMAQLQTVFASADRRLTATEEARARQVYQQTAQIPWLDVHYEVVEASRPEAGTVNYPAAVASSLGLLVLFVFFGMLFGAGWLVEDRRNGTLSRLYAAHGPCLAWYAANWLAMVMVGALLTGLLLLGATGLAGSPPVRGWGALMLLMSYLACVASLGVLLSTLFPSPAQLQAATPVIAIVTGFAGGCLWNQMGSVGGLPWVALATPQGWVLQALGRLYADPAEKTWRQAALVLGVAAAMLALLGWMRLVRVLRRGAVS